MKRALLVLGMVALAATVEERTLAVQPAARVSYHERLKATYKRMGLKPREWMNE